MSLLPFDPRPIITIVMAVALLAWVIVCAVLFVRAARRSMATSGCVGRMRCEHCGAEYEVGASELMRVGLSKSVSVTKTRREGAALVDEPHYLRYSKKLPCPHCGRTTYAQVLNINEINNMMTGPVLRAGVRWLVMMFIGGVLILSAASIPLYFVDQAREQKVEELREQQYEDFKERYGV